MGRRIGLAAAALCACLLVIAALSADNRKHTELEEQSLYIVPQANVLTGAGQRPQNTHPPSGGASAAGGRAQHPSPPLEAAAAQQGVQAGKAKKAAPPPKPAKKPWTAAQVQVEEKVAKEMAREREKREKRYLAQAKKTYQGVRKAAVAHEQRRQSRIAGSLRMDRLKDLETETEIKSASAMKSQELRGRVSEVAEQTSQERQESDAKHADALHNDDLSWQRG
uniref:Transmembrane protein n=1 Tax=Hemiselmis andersenii TaxID=464988 RepID=A0A6T8K3N4_HEMAN|mmetsp:Transcript_18010/g.41660  ORF Transcript_18010/g.41660 Transcript_18010/m.41660 type:complete len:223 (+) Transcript_18010:63-731(+)